MSQDQFSIDKWFSKKITFSLGPGLIIIIILSLSFFVVKATRQKAEEFVNGNDTTGLEISTMVRNVKHELYIADSLRIANKEGALFNLRDFQMEISFTVRQVKKAGVTVGYKFVTVEGGSETGNEKVQKLILRWDAVKPEPIIATPLDSEEVIIVVPN
jgi:hypothetical protein